MLAVMLAVTLTCPSLLHPSKCHRTELTDTVLSTRKTRLDTGVLQYPIFPPFPPFFHHFSIFPIFPCIPVGLVTTGAGDVGAL